MDPRIPIRASRRKRQRTKYTLNDRDDHEILGSGNSSNLDKNGSERDDSEDEYMGENGNQKQGSALSLEEDGNSDSELGEDGTLRWDEHEGEDGTFLEDENICNQPSNISEKPKHVYRQRYREGVVNFSHVGKRERLTSHFGKDAEDLVRAIKCRDKWCNNPTLPTRTVDESGNGGLAHSFFYSEEQREEEATSGWSWYFEEGSREQFRARQREKRLCDDDGLFYLPESERGSHKVLLGRKDAQKLFSLDLKASMNLQAAWTDEVGDEVDVPEENTGRQQKGHESAWLLNVGAKVLCMEWLPNRTDGTQFLALGTVPFRDGKKNVFLSDSSGQYVEGPGISPAFAPAPLKSTCIQVWSFSVRSDAGAEGLMDSVQPPKLHLAICTDWGDIKDFKWCPTAGPRKAKSEVAEVDFDLLAAIWGDGKLRVLEIHDKEDLEGSTTYIKYEQSAFEISTPDTAFTCLTWLSNNQIALGCANGFVAIIDLRHDSETIGVPFFYEPFHQSYVLNIVSGYPSRPDMLVSTSMDGYVRLTDLHAPETDTLLSIRARFGPSAMAWCDPVQGVLIGEETNNTRVYPIRRFFSTTSCARHDGMVFSLAVGKAHPTVLSAGADGEVVITNPMRRTVHLKLAHYQQVWFAHEYSRKSGGISRITEGYKLEKTSLAHTLTSQDDRMVEDGTVLATIFEERSAIDSVCWNPNILYGGWAAAAMGSGLVRVENLAI